MILGIGFDLVEIERVSRIYKRSPRILQTFLTNKEKVYFDQIMNEHRKFEWLSGRFSAKEAAIKAISSGLGILIKFTDIEILYDELGRPTICLTDEIQSKLLFRVNWNLSITHTKTTAGAFVIIEKIL
ncbi:holo-[acyl-carrier-protein] synthase [Bacillus thuringiensis serovar vazensis]|uniref:Holo-[acyl-carrier-protein] synthase n=1 Tax=Bacillus thuringiensis serovar vazensis TaxID=180867 RepID=A0A243CVV6_BACTU|nr:holo-ACP synthase [Bacillus thuringiensis]EEM86330.1 Holo-[acyl-carrier-protein] synthase [Bacillus thuringiensis serovar pulsiensis BGSC 4CC1]OTY75206.1 holo-[acyl-carrier-protein] synthase [Bacillus thuringiensis serovar vazensis]